MAVTFGATNPDSISFSPLVAPLSTGLTDMTYMAWIYPTALTGGGFGNMFMQDVDSVNPGTVGVFFFISAQWGSATNTAVFFWPWATNGGAWSPGNGLVSINTKYHLAVAYNNSLVSNTPTFYVNGVLKTTTLVQSPAGALQNPTGGSIQIGQISSNLASWQFFGKVQDARIYNRQLSASEVSGIYASGSPTSLETNDNGLVFHAPMLIGTGITPPWNGTALAAGNKLIDRINCVPGTPSGSPTGASDFVFGTSY